MHPRRMIPVRTDPILRSHFLPRTYADRGGLGGIVRRPSGFFFFVVVVIVNPAADVW